MQNEGFLYGFIIIYFLFFFRNNNLLPDKNCLIHKIGQMNFLYSLKSFHFNKICRNYFVKRSSDVLTYDIIQDKNIDSKLKIFAFTPTKVFNCLFLGISSIERGGAITSFGCLFLDHSSFFLCSSSKGGGAVYSAGKTICNNCEFSSCSSNFCAALMIQMTRFLPIQIQRSTFSLNHCNLDGILTGYQPNSTEIFENNVSECEANGRFGGIVLSKTDAKLSYLIFENIQKPELCCGLIFQNCVSLFVENSIFINLTRNDGNDYGGTALLSEYNPQNSKVTKCSFINCSSDGLPSLHHFGDHPLTVTQCCFSLNQDKEMNMPTKHILFYDNIFEQNNCSIASFQQQMSSMIFNENISHFHYKNIVFKSTKPFYLISLISFPIILMFIGYSIIFHFK